MSGKLQLNQDRMSKSTRRQLLLDLIEARGYLRLGEASAELGVSEQTVRRDIKALDSLGKVRRTHGGASFLGALDAETFHKRQRSQASEKSSIAKRISGLIPDGASVFLDIGTTCEEVAGALLDRQNLRVVTYSIRCAAKFADRSDFTVAIPSGIVRPVDGAIVGPQDDGFVEQFNFDYAIIAVSGLDKHGRLSDDDAFEVKRVRTAMGKASETILALTSDKIGVTALVNLASLDEISCVVVETPKHPILTQIAAEHDVRVIGPGDAAGADSDAVGARDRTPEL